MYRAAVNVYGLFPMNRIDLTRANYGEQRHSACRKSEPDIMPVISRPTRSLTTGGCRPQSQGHG
jgi:hypothetical protein